ncbi:unnamed protein product [Didymodactylos carnosus]|uniref:YrhK domain-containing protein n=1 Tax=Didymodactylos carnosus TaxID=1234261 RepID=A0A815YYZ5_9BILA|nr:unnamed protein product [Didymodactylos carnosus]CAF1576024.1 unnamed protein product [Didymodactylos carnosus]CAF4034964.1 unnamed protein product [Didymodactylos carnosus]CAF4441055.1 unnamed protein product [Didymodactylos carnosus]
MNSESDRKPLVIPDGNILDRPQSLTWRFFHGTHYMLGGLFFICGSCMYFPTAIHNPNFRSLNVGGWLFTTGSFFFLLADLQEWYYYRIGCCFDKKYRSTYETVNADLFQHPKNSIRGVYERAVIGINFFMSACGSALYLAGSILFIEVFSKYLVVGEWLFIIGSAVIYISQGWKLYRSGCTNINNRHDQKFTISNLLNDKPALGVDFFAGAGGIFYFIGTILFLPQFNKTDSDEGLSAIIFVIGGTCFTLSGLFLQYRHYFTKHL